MRILALAAVVMIAAGLLAGTASAHTIALGTTSGGGPGSVTIWMGSYDNSGSGSDSPEGSITIGSTTKSFITDASAQFEQGATPTGLILGTNYWYADNGATGSYTALTQPTSSSFPTYNWQAVTFTGLTAGSHTYTISGMSTVIWQDWNSSASNWTGTITIAASSVSVPEPGSLALLGLGLAGLGFGAHRRRRRANA